MKPIAMPIHTLRALLGGVLATALCAPSMAFIDERSPPAPAQVPFQPGASSVPIASAPLTLTTAPAPGEQYQVATPGPARSPANGALNGSFAEMAWLGPIPASGATGQMPLSMAIMQAVPPAIGTVQLDGDSAAFSRMVVLPSGTSYQAALASVAQQAGVRIERYLKTFRVVDLAGGQAVRPTATAAGLGVAPSGDLAMAGGALVQAEAAPVAAPPRPPYTVSVSDVNLRRTLVRWAKTAGWVFEPEHWQVKVDIPLTASASFSPDFKESVQDLLSSSELGDTPVHGCFYTNKVLRVIPYTERCDRTAGR
ncbi:MULTISPECIES: toxin co-regulated pilus biosynthesis Q family protein [Achromobacter]|uniref:Toxin co-regulated pilus biosynthesis protein Q C-terminal domain-containing protein n=2 Tax=Achromobacter TaxID=222 RepID=A0ABM8LKC4_9BURK|nr:MULTISPECIES: toxin co-regulated pilus biosynthesis Q family protein [Achromobacter]AVG43826.1 hypothetical protein MC81_30380 [Achromobacter insolitus]CAB3846855.1 hypothetical protein LMG3410_01562 [Achromobacter aegrifaciens]CAB3913200.1 hypothetical protein LMG3415_05086 [Achromobacter mucicolens]